MKAAVVIFPGSNCDRDLAVALAASLGHEPELVWHRDRVLPKVDLIALPGGFSYGDYLRAGAMAAHAPIMRAVVEAARRGVPVLGICNGFQVLTECGLLPGVLMRNRKLRFLCRQVHLRVATPAPPFTAGFRSGEVVTMPIAHNDGNYFADSETLAALENEDRIAFRYCTAQGEVSDDAAPNGAINAIAGVLNETRNVLGMMPHPERAADPAHGGTDGRRMLDGLVEALS